MGVAKYISLISTNKNSNGGYVALFSPSKGGETAGSIARSQNSFGGESAGTVAYSGYSSGGASFSSSGCSFTAIA